MPTKTTVTDVNIFKEFFLDNPVFDRVKATGSISIPKEIVQVLLLSPGDNYCMEYDKNNKCLIISNAEGRTRCRLCNKMILPRSQVTYKDYIVCKNCVKELKKMADI